MSNVASVRKEVEILKRALEPKKEPILSARAVAIIESLREYERVMEESGFNKLSPREKMECELKETEEVVRHYARQGLWGPEVAAKYEEGKQE